MGKSKQNLNNQEQQQRILINEVLTVIEKAIQKCPKYNLKENYLLEMRKANILNQTLRSQIIIQQEEIKLSTNEVLQSSKKNRRKAGDIQKKYKCCTVSCNKAYGSEGSLHLHQRIKNHTNHSECDTVSQNSAQVQIVTVC